MNEMPVISQPLVGAILPDGADDDPIAQRDVSERQRREKRGLHYRLQVSVRRDSRM